MSGPPLTFQERLEGMRLLKKTRPPILYQPAAPARAVMAPPPMPEMVHGGGYSTPIKVPQGNEDWIWVTDRSNMEGKWRQIGSPINEQDVGRSTFETIGHDQSYQPQHHGVNSGSIVNQTDRQLRTILHNRGLPITGTRKELFEKSFRLWHDPAYSDQYPPLDNPGPMPRVPSALPPRTPVRLPPRSSSLGQLALGQQAAAAQGVALAGPPAAVPEIGMAQGAANFAAAAGPVLALGLMANQAGQALTANKREKTQTQQARMYRT